MPAAIKRLPGLRKALLRRAGRADVRPNDVAEVIAQLLAHDAAVGVGCIATPGFDARDERCRRRRQPQANELATGFARDRLDGDTLVLFGEHGVDDDGMTCLERPPRLVLDDAVDALRRTDAVVLAL